MIKQQHEREQQSNQVIGLLLRGSPSFRRYKKAVGGDESPTAIQKIWKCVSLGFPKSQNYLCDPLEAKIFAGHFLRAKARLDRLGKLGVFQSGTAFSRMTSIDAR